ncbi:MAG: nitrous oxide reductase family maturation protein NosD [Verrucomicrobia bacterium]|nr:nitrous oxide reductase family maturation protein NosD [Verrucomicrobiota bacterium]
MILASLTLPIQSATVPVKTSLARAIAEAHTGDTVVVDGPSVFHERVVIDKPLRLLGVGSPALDADGTGTPLTIAADNVEVRGLIMRNGGADTGHFDSGIMITGSRATVGDCRVEGGGFGIYIRGANECRLEANTTVGNTNVTPSQRGNGIQLWKTRRNRIVNNVITGTRDGAYFSYADENLIASNRIEHTRFGIHYMYSNRNRLVGNTLTANSVGAALMFARDCEVDGNRAFANRRHGILLKQVENSRLTRNVVFGQNRGFFIQQAVNDHFEGNWIANNDIGLHLSNGSEQNRFAGNAFVNNTRQVWQPTDEVELGRLASNAFFDRSRGNFWSDYTGVDANGDGIGDTPYHETDVFGYLVDRHPAARLFALSPALALLRKGEELLPLLDMAGVNDPFPLMRPPVSLSLVGADVRKSSSEIRRAKSQVRNNQIFVTSVKKRQPPVP